MAKKENNSNHHQPSLGEISTIRDILMGDKINNYESRFAELEASLGKLEQLMSSKISQTEAHFNSVSENINSNFEQRLIAIEKRLMEAIEKSNIKTEKNINSDKVRLGKLLSDLGKKLSGE